MTADGSTVDLEFTIADYERSHGRRPQGRGYWGFRASTHRTAFDSEMFGPIEFFEGTLTEAKAAAKASGIFAEAPFVAVLG